MASLRKLGVKITRYWTHKEERNVFLASWAYERGKKWSSLTLNGNWARVQFRVSVFTRMKWFRFCFLPNRCNGFFPPTSPLLVQNKKKKKGRKKEKCEFVRQQYIRFRKIFFIFSFSCCKIFVMVVIKVLLHCRVADKWHSVCEKKYACVILYFQQFYATSHNFT